MSIVQNTVPPNESLVFPVDPDHGGIRLLILAAFIAAWLIGFTTANALIVNEGLNLIALAAGFALGGAVTIPLERFLKGRWKSGRILALSDAGVRLEKKGKPETVIQAADIAQTIFWRFEVQRRSRVPKGWSMLACAIESEGRYLPIYTFVSPNTLKELPTADRFKRLANRKEREKSGDIRGEMRLAGEQRRLLDAEKHRWMDGAEMTFTDFQTYLTTLETRFPEWMPVE